MRRLLSGKKRKPAWTDRILWRVRLEASPEEKDRKDDSQDPERTRQIEEEAHPLKVTQELYTSNMKYGVSDHKPVISVFNLQVRNWLADNRTDLRKDYLMKQQLLGHREEIHLEPGDELVVVPRCCRRAREQHCCLKNKSKLN